MHNWFECSIRYEKVAENGMNRKVTEAYLVDALSFTEAEARIIEEMNPYINGVFTVSGVKRAGYSELFPSEEDAADRWFKCKLDEGMKGTLADYVIGSVAETAIMDVYPYTADVKPEFSGDDKKEV